MRDLLTLTRAQGANRALINREVAPAGYRLSFADEPVLVKGFRKMVRGLEYDVAEMALTTYLTAKEHGARFTALPVFLVRDFHHGAVQVLRDGPVSTAKDLAGGRVGVNRGYTVTTGVWGRAALADAGLDLDSVTWVLSGDEHVATYVRPANVVSAPEGTSLEDLLLAGDLEAVIGASIDHPDVTTLFADPEETAMGVLRERGVFPVNHLVVVRDDLLAEQPALSVALFEAFAEAKRRYVGRLRNGLEETKQDSLLRRVMTTTGRDPLPYGLEPNRATLEELMQHARDQHILVRPVALEDIFVANTLALHD
ncbi:4,5-dihydroxyphthalate decarboxylase [Nocardioides terrae]|uniref:4,5-dihydroxyphthalate decarboxylase n=1 Tax=Nocardioides terrae TaxID=574651 RepID=A0A1I1EHF6_9ACTN|nr:4,5-dihydroxyphthalate decarboxylase [Nocardioides terrae]SFB86575.1 4,5-dihydroxyphthalate decarboxylase [Nocardioides terrae]